MYYVVNVNNAGHFLVIEGKPLLDFIKADYCFEPKTLFKRHICYILPEENCIEISLETLFNLSKSFDSRVDIYKVIKQMFYYKENNNKLSNVKRNPLNKSICNFIDERKENKKLDKFHHISLDFTHSCRVCHKYLVVDDQIVNILQNKYHCFKDTSKNCYLYGTDEDHKENFIPIMCSDIALIQEEINDAYLKEVDFSSTPERTISLSENHELINPKYGFLAKQFDKFLDDKKQNAPSYVSYEDFLKSMENGYIINPNIEKAEPEQYESKVSIDNKKSRHEDACDSLAYSIPRINEEPHFIKPKEEMKPPYEVSADLLLEYFEENQCENIEKETLMHFYSLIVNSPKSLFNKKYVPYRFFDEDNCHLISENIKTFFDNARYGKSSLKQQYFVCCSGSPFSYYSCIIEYTEKGIEIIERFDFECEEPEVLSYII